MTTFTQTVEETFHVVLCYSCGVSFGINSQIYERAVVNKEGCIHCPACGKTSGWYGKTPIQKVREEMQRKLNVANNRADFHQAKASREKSRATAALKSLSATKGVVTKMKNRISKGVCPVPGCKRTFLESCMQRHIEAKHPEWKPPEDFADSKT